MSKKSKKIKFSFICPAGTSEQLKCVAPLPMPKVVVLFEDGTVRTGNVISVENNPISSDNYSEHLISTIRVRFNYEPL